MESFIKLINFDLRDAKAKFMHHSRYFHNASAESSKTLLSSAPSEEALEKLQDFDDELPKRKRHQHRPSSIIHAFFTAFLFLSSVVLFWDYRKSRSSFHEKCVYSLSTPSPGLEAAAAEPYVSYYFNGSFGGNKDWRGPPSPELDQLWKEKTGDPTYVPLTDEEVRAMGKNPEQMHRVPAELRHEYGDGIMGGMEVFHQLHCLNMIRKYTYMDYYGEELLSYATPRILRVHIDHCIDMMRQLIMCTGDTSMVLSYWIEGRRLPMPDFSTMHTCRDFDALVEWQKDHNIKEFKFVGTPSPDEMVFTRPNRPDTAQ